jgi:hypothetical protein
VAGIDVARGQLVTLIVGEQHTRCGDTAHRDAAASRITQSPWSSHEIMGGAAVHIARLPTRIRPTSEPRAEEAAPTSASEAAEFTPITPAGLVRTLPDEAPDRDPTATEDRVVGLEPRRTAAVAAPAGGSAAASVQRRRRGGGAAALIATAALLMTVGVMAGALVGGARRSGYLGRSIPRRTGAAPVARARQAAPRLDRRRVDPRHHARTLQPPAVGGAARQRVSHVTGAPERAGAAVSTTPVQIGSGRRGSGEANRGYSAVAHAAAPQASAVAAATPPVRAASAAPTQSVAPTGPVPGPPPSQLGGT